MGNSLRDIKVMNSGYTVDKISPEDFSNRNFLDKQLVAHPSTDSESEHLEMRDCVKKHNYFECQTTD